MANVASLYSLLEYQLIYCLQLNGYYRHLEQLVWPVHPPDEASRNRYLLFKVPSTSLHGVVGLPRWVLRRSVLAVESPATLAAYRYEHDQLSSIYLGGIYSDNVLYGPKLRFLVSGR